MYFFRALTQQELLQVWHLIALLRLKEVIMHRLKDACSLWPLKMQKLQKWADMANLFFPLFSISSEYYPVVMVPAGARSIRVQEMEISTSYLAVRSLKRGTYYLTGDWTVDWPGRFQFAGTTFNYQRSFNRPETLYAAGPTNETLLFEVSHPRPRPAWHLLAN